MKHALWLALWASLAIFFATPAVLALVDAWCYVVTGRTQTGVEWNEGTFIIACLLLIPAAVAGGVAAFAADE